MSPARLICFVGLILLARHAFAAEPSGATNDPAVLTLERIFESSDFEGESYSARWTEEGAGYLRWEKSEATKGGKDLVEHDPKTDAKTILIEASLLIPSGEGSPLSVSSYAFSKDKSKLLIFTNTRRVWRTNTRGDYWVLDRTSRELRQLGGGEAKPSTLMFAKFSPDGLKVAFARERNLYVENLVTRKITALTHSTSPDELNGTFDWVYEEELYLHDGFRWSPDSRSLAYWQMDTTGVGAFPLVNQTDSLYPQVSWLKYPKAGERNSSARVGVVGINGGATKWLDVPGDPRENYIHFVDWRTNSGGIVVQQFNRLQNTNRVFVANPNTGKVKVVLTETDKAWVDQQSQLKWLDEGKKFIWLSERSGWRRAYLTSIKDGEPHAITPDGMDVVAVLEVDKENETLYFTASPTNATQRYLYRAPLKGGKAERLSPQDQPGTHSVSIAPGAHWAIDVWSNAGQSAVSTLISLPDHKVVRVLEENKKLRDTFGKVAHAPLEFFKVDIGDGVKLDAFCIKPPDFDPGKKYPLMINVYGEPAGQTVLDNWSGSQRFWHYMLAQRGCVIMSFDNRGTPSPRGRAWRKSVDRQVGILAPEDQAKALRKVLEQRPYLDPNRVAIWGWSGGGSMTLDAMLKFPELYKTGIAVAAVPNQRLYDSIYQERYMGLPQDNVEGYRNGSAINFAGQLQGNLLIVHGTGDDNVHYQGAEAMINELVSHKKTFQMMAYPNRSHGIYEGQNTSIHLFTMMTSFLQQHLGLQAAPAISAKDTALPKP